MENSTEPEIKKNRKAPKVTSLNTKRRQAENYLSKRFRFKFNVVTGAIEWADREKGKFKILDDYKLNSLSRQIDSELGLEVGTDKLARWLKSDFTPTFHPIKSYFQQMQTEENIDGFIAKLAATVTTKNPTLFSIALRRWLIASVANVLNDEGCQNQTCLVLTGSQGAFKTTWLNNLCPPDMSRYLYSGRIELGSKDTYMLLASQFIINLDDQLRELNKRDAETIKTLITHGKVTIRRPYDQLFSTQPRIASFVSSINGSDFLTDPTGSRRFLPFEVEHIDIVATQAIDMNKVWAEAYKLYQSGEQYWFTTEETSEFFANNEDFQVHTPEYEILLQYYKPVMSEGDATHTMTTTEILIELNAKTRYPMRMKELGAALKKCGFLHKSKRIGKATSKRYFLCQRKENEGEEHDFEHGL